MPSRRRLLAWLGGAALVIGAVVVLRATDDALAPPRPPDNADVKPPVRITQFAADNVVLPQPGARPAPPTGLGAVPAPGRLRVTWSDGVPRGGPSAGAVGYEVRWERVGEDARTRLVIAPDTQLEDLVDGQTYQVQVRSIDVFGRRSAPAVTTGVPGPADDSWRAGLTGLFDDFSSPASVLAGSTGSHWHVSGYRGCVDLGPGSVGGKGLPIDLGCGADVAVLRARQLLRLTPSPGPDGVLGRVALVTDTAGPGGELTVDLVPGLADRVGAGRTNPGPGPDPSLPAGTIRVIVNDGGAVVRGATGTPEVRPVHTSIPAPRRGPGSLHLFEVSVTTSGVQVRQDGTLVAIGGLVPSWREASVLLGFRGPEGHRSRVHLAAAGFTGESAALPTVVEAPVNPATQQVLSLDEEAPGIGIARTPLVSATAARLVATITTAAGLDVNGIVVQLGDTTFAARPATPSPPVAPGSAVTVTGDVPASLIGDHGQGSLAPFVLRAPGAGDGVLVVESYLEITPGPGWRPATGSGDNTDPRRPAPDALPRVAVTLGNAAGAPLPTTAVPAHGQLVLTVSLDATAAQWDSGGVAGVQGFELWLDGQVIAGVPTAADGPGIGGRYAVSIALGGLRRGPHVLEVREYGPNGAAPPVSLLRNFLVS